MRKYIMINLVHGVRIQEGPPTRPKKGKDYQASCRVWKGLLEAFDPLPLSLLQHDKA